jgi:thiaminase/transcriptional activator TenA
VSTASSLIAEHRDAWFAATHHPFLEAVRDGSLPPPAFNAWLTQDYQFVIAEVAAIARLLSVAPRSAQSLLIGSLAALEAELSWFEGHAVRRGLSLDGDVHPTTRAYCEFLRGLEHRSYESAMTALWAIECAYLEAWQSAAPGQGQYREFVEHWTTPEFAAYVSALENLVTEPDAAAFLEVARLERAFWDMALT